VVVGCGLKPVLVYRGARREHRESGKSFILFMIKAILVKESVAKCD